MAITSRGVEVNQYWSPEPVSELRLKSDAEYVEAFLEVFTQAVTARLRSHRPVGVTLSGGLDSGSVTAIAAQILGKRGKNLVGFTSAPFNDPGFYNDPQRIGDETQLAQATAQHAGNVDHFLVRSETTTPIVGLKRMLSIHDEPGFAAANQFWLGAILEAARLRNVGVLLTGQMGNATISWAGLAENLFLMLMAGDIAGFRQAFDRTRSGAGLGVWRGVRRFLIKPMLLPLWVQYQQFLERLRDPWLEYSAILPEFARKINLRQQMKTAGFSPTIPPADPLQYRLRIIQPGQITLGSSWFEKGSAHGLEVRDPTQDRRLIELCLAIPDSQFRRH
jgi:asparagine synthase (glutamine-hydrolysing)